MNSEYFHICFLCPHFLPTSLWILLPPSASRGDTIIRCERSHVEKRGSLRKMISKWLTPQQVSISPCLFRWNGSTVPYQLTAFNQTLSTPSIIHPVCMWDPQLACTSFSFFFFLSGIGAVSRFTERPGSCCSRHHHCSTQLTHQKSISVQQGVCNTSRHNKLPREGEHTQICPCIKY